MLCHIHTVRHIQYMEDEVSQNYRQTFISRAGSRKYQRPVSTCHLYLGLPLLTSTDWLPIPSSLKSTVWCWWNLSPFIVKQNPPAIIGTVLKRIQRESLMMMLVTMNSVSAGGLQWFLFYLLFSVLQNIFVQWSHQIDFKDALTGNMSALMMSQTSDLN